jgi:hypothetical protein
MGRASMCEQIFAAFLARSEGQKARNFVPGAPDGAAFIWGVLGAGFAAERRGSLSGIETARMDERPLRPSYGSWAAEPCLAYEMQNLYGL